MNKINTVNDSFYQLLKSNSTVYRNNCGKIEMKVISLKKILYHDMIILFLHKQS